METTQQGVAIEPIVFPLNQGTATRMTVLVFQFTTTATTTGTYWELITEEGKALQSGNYYLTEEQFAEWGKDNTIVNDYVAESIGVVII